MIEVFKVAQGSYQIKLCWRWLGSRHSRAQNFTAASAMCRECSGTQGQSWVQTVPPERGLGGLQSSCCSQVTLTLALSFKHQIQHTPIYPLRASTWMFSSLSAVLPFPSLLKTPDSSWPSVPSPLQEAQARPGDVLRVCPFSAFLPCLSLSGVFPVSHPSCATWNSLPCPSHASPLYPPGQPECFPWVGTG